MFSLMPRLSLIGNDNSEAKREDLTETISASPDNDDDDDEKDVFDNNGDVSDLLTSGKTLFLRNMAPKRLDDG